jgi:hypothetical protein
MELRLCSRWLRFLNQKDPRVQRDVPELLQEFGIREGYSVGELDATFREEEALALEAERLKKLALQRLKSR